MSIKTLLFAVGALALAACDSPTAPKTVDVQTMVAPPWPTVRRAERIAFTSDRAGAPGYKEIYTMNPDGTDLVRLTNSPGYDAEPALSRDGSKIAFVSFREGTYCCGVYVMNASDGSGAVRLTNGYSPAWSPDGSKIAFTRFGSGGYSIYVMNVADNVLTVPARIGIVLLGNGDHPTWSPDGSKIAFTGAHTDCGLSVCHDIYVMNADGTGVVRLTNDSAYADDPAWSPDGSRIAFSSNRTWNSQIYVIYADGSGRARLTNNTYWDYDPTWSPSGGSIAFTSRRDGNDEIYTMNARDGSGVVRLTNNAAFDGEASWAWR